MGTKREPRVRYFREFADSLIGLSMSAHDTEDAAWGDRVGKDRDNASFKVVRFVEDVEEYKYERDNYA